MARSGAEAGDGTQAEWGRRGQKAGPRWGPKVWGRRGRAEKLRRKTQEGAPRIGTQIGARNGTSFK